MSFTDGVVESTNAACAAYNSNKPSLWVIAPDFETKSRP
jgi:hypothetical protein